MEDNQNIKEGIKQTAVFGSVGVVNIFVSVLKSKIIAILLGPTGMGLFDIFNSAISMISYFTNFNLRTSAVKDVAIAFNSEDKDNVNEVYSVFWKLILLTGLFGLLVFLLLSPLLSLSSFGDYSYTWAFLLLASVLFFTQLNEGQNVLLQGSRHFRDLALSNLFGNIITVIVSIPLFYLLGINGVVVSIIASITSRYFFTKYYTGKLSVQKHRITIRYAFNKGKSMMNMGMFLALQGAFSTFSAYIIRVVISRLGGIDDVGLYAAALVIVDNYTGIIFSAMANDYYPRLSIAAQKNDNVNDVINSQTKLTLLLFGPLIVIFELFGFLIINLLYTSDFLGILWFVNFAMISIFLKGPSWCLSFTFLAKGQSKLFFYSEFVSKIVSVSLIIGAYYFWGLNGIGIAYIVDFFIYYFIEYFLAKRINGYLFDKSILKIVLPQVLLAILSMIVAFTLDGWVRHSIAFIIIFISIIIAYRELNNYIDLKKVRYAIKSRIKSKS